MADAPHGETLEEALKTAPVKVDLVDALRQLNAAEPLRLLHLIELKRERARRAAQSTYDFIDREMPNATFVVDQFGMIRNRKEQIPVDGHILDLGVYRGGSTKRLAAIFGERRIYGFDSFEGLPEDWSHCVKGDFGDLKGVLPEMPPSVKLVPGWFDDTLPVWAKEHEGQTIALLRVDCDIYSSAKTIFDTLGHMLRPGTWICFDELIGYYGWQQHEHKAFMEFIAETGFAYEYVAYGETYTLVRLGEAR